MVYQSGVLEYLSSTNYSPPWRLITQTQNNFLRQLRNFDIDITQARMTDVAALHWQVAQATSIENVHFYMSSDADKGHVGICTYHIPLDILFAIASDDI